MQARGPGILFKVGDAADEEVLRELGVARARTLIASLADDRDNFLLCVTARALNPSIGLMVRLVNPANAEMFAELGADAVVHPPALSGVRLANELLMPDLTAFTDRMLEGDAGQLELAEVVIPARSATIGEPVAALDPKASPGVLVLGVRRAGASPDAAFAFGPSWEHRVQAGDTLFVLAARKPLAQLLARVEAPAQQMLAAASLSGRLPPAASAGVGANPDATPDATAGDRNGHVVVVGAGAVGRSAVREILRQGVDVTVVDRSEQQLALFEPDPRLTLLRGDVSDRQTLMAADLGGARGFITALQPLRDNLFLAASVHSKNPGLRVVARVCNQAEARRLRAVGALVVNPGEIGGVDLAHRTMRPELVDFARGLEASWSHPEQLAVVPIVSLPPRVRDIAALEIHTRTMCVILGYRARASGVFTYHPVPGTLLRLGGAFVALGEPSHIAALRALVGAPDRLGLPPVSAHGRA